jgi:hypothetical protein
MKKTFSASALLLICISSYAMGLFTLIKDELPKDHVFNKVKLVVKDLRKSHFNQFVLYTRRSVVEDEDYSEAQKKEILNRVEKYEFKENQFFGYTMAYDRPFLDEEIDIKFQLLNSQNEDLLESVDLFKIKHHMISSYGTTTSYNYTWILVSKVPLNKGSIDKTSQPVHLVLTFKDGKQRIYDTKITK